MKKTVRILLIDDQEEFYNVLIKSWPKLSKGLSLKNVEKPQYGFAEASPKLWEASNEVIISRLAGDLKEQFFDKYHDCDWLILLDFQLSVNERITTLYHEAVLEAICDNPSAFLMLYTSQAGDYCSTLYENILDKFEEAEIGEEPKFCFYNGLLSLYFTGTPTNYEQTVKNEIFEAITAIQKGELDNELWSHSQEPERDCKDT